MTTEAPEFPETMYPPLVPLTDGDRLTAAIERLATAVEQLALATIDSKPVLHVGPATVQVPQNATPIPQANVTQFAPLPQVNPQRPACPRHGVDSVVPSTKRGVAFYCKAKDPNGPRGWCSFTVAA